MDPSRRPTLALSTAAAVLAGLAVGLQAGEAQAPVPDVCPGGRLVQGVVECAALFASGTPLHLPADLSATQRYGAIKRGGDRFWTRDGDVPIAKAAAASVVGDGSRRRQYPNVAYLATITGGKVTALQPAVQVTERAVLAKLFAGRTMEGTIGTADGPQRFSMTRTLPVRLAFARRPTIGALPGRIVNAARAVRSSGGTCLPALGRAGKRNPLHSGFTAKVRLQRQPSMHAPYDDEMLIRWNANASNMGRSFYPSIATLLGGDPLGTSWLAEIHGSPDAGPALRLRFVTGGGRRC